MKSSILVICVDIWAHVNIIVDSLFISVFTCADFTSLISRLCTLCELYEKPSLLVELQRKCQDHDR